MNSKKLTGTGEISYVLAVIFTTLGVAMMTKADFGLSMVVAPAYLISQKLSFLTFGTAEYAVQALLLICLFITLRKIEWRFALTFISALIYGAALDLFVFCIDAYTTPQSLAPRIAFFVFGLVFSDIGVSLYFNSYLPPCCYDMFVKELSAGLHLNQPKVKIIYDYSSLAVSLLLSFLFFGKLQGIGIGTFVTVVLNGPLINMFNKLFAKFTDFSPKFKKLHSVIATNIK